MINSYRPVLWKSLTMVVAAFGVPIAAQAQGVDSATAAKLDFLNDRLNALFGTGPNGLVTGNFFVPQRTYGNTDPAKNGPPPDGKPQFGFNILAPSAGIRMRIRCRQAGPQRSSFHPIFVWGLRITSRG